MLVSIKLSRNTPFSASDKPRMLFFLLIKVKMPTIVGILTYISRKAELSRSIFITSTPVCICILPKSDYAARSKMWIIYNLMYAFMHYDRGRAMFHLLSII